MAGKLIKINLRIQQTRATLFSTSLGQEELVLPMQPAGLRATSPHIALICQDVGNPSHRPEKELSGNVDLVASAASFSALFSADHQCYE
jgi:hypothetical protein